jgi:hypothetical protein
MLRERFPAGVARVRLLAGVSPFVHDQRGSLVKGLAAHVADQGLLATVQAQVVLKGSLRGDGLAAQVTVVFVLACVRFDVHHERILISERLAAKLTLMLHRLEVRIVNLHVPYQSVIVGERLVADSAHVLLGAVLHVHVPMQFGIREEALVAYVAMPRVLLKVTSMMGGQLRGLHKRATAHVANEVLLVGVDSPMHCQSVGPLEGLAANVALIRPSVTVRY